MDTRAFIVCAEWCGVCRELKASAPLWLNGTLSWIDLDEDEKILEGLDVEYFPTLAVFRDSEWVYWGSCEPTWLQIIRIAESARIDVDPTLISHLDKMQQTLSHSR